SYFSFGSKEQTMNKKAITLICIFILLASLQIACSFSDVISSSGNDRPQIPPQESGESQPQPPDQKEEGDSQAVSNSQPEADQSSCTKTFTGSTNLVDGQEFEAGDTIQVIFTLTNTGTCTWNTAYSLVSIGGDFSPASNNLALGSNVIPGESVQLEASYTAPSQAGPYLSIWKMEDSVGGVFGQIDPPGSPIRIKVRSITSGNPQPTPTPNPTPEPQIPPETNPDASLEMDGVTLMEDHCYDLTSGAEVDCNDNKAHIRYSHATYGPFAGHNMTGGQNTDLSPNQNDEPEKSDCENASYAPLPHSVEEGKFFCFKIESVLSTVYGWIRIVSYNDNGVTFDFLTFKADPPIVTVNTNLFVETQGQQLTILEGECYDIHNGQKNTSCSGIFAGFLYEEVTKKSLQVMQINPNEAYFAVAMSSEPSKSDCQNASYNTTPIWPIQETNYYCYQFVPGSTAYYGWLRPTSFNSSGMTFDYLTWQTSP
ncbi:MAG: NBR1-Ig-like domain-containing protein, partial [Anaerolineales bacterium]|nr:NBR1-Ig-like domain-containing protein [Anaerolineales bacterium]